MALKVSDIFSDMLSAARESFADSWPKVRDYARPEMKKLAQSLVDITRLAAQGKVNKQQAKALLNIHANTAKMVMLTVEGLGLIAVENAINAAFKAAADAVNAAAGLKIL
jgi:hypothetical protein